MPDLHVIPSGDLWDIKEETVTWSAPTTPRPKQKRPGKNGCDFTGEVFTHREEGDFSRIRKGDAV
jgi:hypothetical protein